MAKALIVEIFGNAKQFGEELDRAAGKTRKFGAAAGVAGVAIATGLAIALEKSVEAAIKAQEEQGKLDQAFQNAGLNADKLKGKTNALEAANRKLGFTNNDTRESLTKLITAGDGVAKATTDMSEAADLARYKNESLGEATTALIKIHAGNARALKEVGIVMPSVTSAADALTEKHKALSKEEQAATDATYKHELALAKVQDKLTTGAQAAQLLGEKIHGQATEFSESAKGGMEQFHAQLGALEEKIGTGLLPAMTAMIQGVSRAISYVVTNWPQIRAAIAPVMQQIEDIIRVVLADAEALWQRFGGTITTVFKNNEKVIKAALTVIADVFKVFGDLLKGDWSKLWTDLEKLGEAALKLIGTAIKAEFDVIKGLMTNLGTIAVHALEAGLKALPGAMIRGLKAINTAITNAEGWVFSEALKIGEQLVAGIVDGVKGLGASLKNKVTGEISGAISGIKGAFHIHSPSQVTHDQIGVPLGEGVVEGWKTGIAPLSAIISDNLDSIFVAARARVAKGWADMLKETTKNAVPGVTTAGTIDAINAITSAQDAATQKIADYTAKYVDTTFATPGYSVGMSAAEVYALSGNQPASNPVTVNINGPVYGADSQQLAQSVQQEFLRMQAQGTVLGFA